jgi:hypothetical protein
MRFPWRHIYAFLLTLSRLFSKARNTAKPTRGNIVKVKGKPLRRKKLLDDARFKTSLAKACLAFPSSFANASEISIRFATDERITGHWPGQPHTSILLRYFIRHALDNAHKNAAKDYRKLAKAFNKHSDLKAPQRGYIESLADEFIALLEPVEP